MNEDDDVLVSRVFGVPDRPEDADELKHAPLANLRATAASTQAKALVSELADRYPRQANAQGKHYARVKTKEGYKNANAAFLAELLSAYGDDYRGGWIRSSLDKDNFKGQRVTYRMFNDVRQSWSEAGLVEHRAGYPGMLRFGNPGPSHGKLTRYKATPTLLEVCAKYDITPDNTHEHFQFEFEMPSELVQLTSPSRRTPDKPQVVKLRKEVQELNEFFAKHALTPPSIKHIGWVRKFHLANHPDFRWNKGGRLYSQPPTKDANYQNIDKNARLKMEIDDEPVAEIDIGSSYLTIFYAWNDKQLDPEQDAYKGILGDTEMDRIVAKTWINASFGNKALLSKWSKDLKKDVQDKLLSKGIAATAFDPKRYPMKMIKEIVLQRHPLLERWGGQIRGRVRDYGDLMFVESQVIIGAMLELKRNHGVPSMPVHDSLIVPYTQRELAEQLLREQFRRKTGVVPRLEVKSPWDF
jgi:hypothetical protein